LFFLEFLYILFSSDSFCLQIRSIGVNVQANKAGLQQLNESMASVNDKSHSIEEALGSLRDQVAEKIRVQRLLTRLDTLLKLPATLQQQIEAGRYRTATKNYLAAASILAKHSEGFESLKNIETECSVILENLQKDLEHKLLHWSGRLTGLEPNYSEDGADSYMSSGGASSSNSGGGASGIGADAPDPPKNISEVFECAGTLFILHHQKKQAAGAVAVIDVDADSSTKLSTEDLCSMAVAAAMRLLDRILDTHLIEVQERRFSGLDLSNGGGGGQAESRTAIMALANEDLQQQEKGNILIPREFLDAVLEGATLYGVSFGSALASNAPNTNDPAGGGGGGDGSNSGSGAGSGAGGDAAAATNYYLLEFVQEAFSSFLSHVRSILLEESVQASREESVATEEGMGGGGGSEATHKEISDALVLLVEDVRELASGLTLPEVGISPDYAAQLLDQAMELTESMVRRRVDQRFHDLRLSVVKDCLVPFAHKAVEEREKAIKEEKVALPLILQIASSTLSDCLQLVDDAIRSIFADSSSASTGDLPDLKEAVHASTYRFASWLANAFEILAGGDSTDSKHIAEAPLEVEASERVSDDGSHSDGLEGYDGTADKGSMVDDLGEFSDKELVDLLDSARDHLIDGSAEDNNDGALNSDFILAIADLCRISEESVPENLEQSFATHLGDGKKKSRGIFPTGKSPIKDSAEGEEGEIEKQFKLASSRVLVLYATNCGIHAAAVLCRDLADTSSKPDSDAPEQPSSSALDVLSLAKKTALECANIFGGSTRGGPVPKWEDDVLQGLSSPMAMMGRKTGLQLDIERMFKEKVAIYPHPLEILEASRNAVLFLFFRIVFRALYENARLYKFSSGGYQQLQVDAMFLKHMVPHYVSSDYSEHGTNACAALSSLLADAMELFGDRCTDESCAQDEGLKREARDVVRTFLATMNDDSNLADMFIIQESKK